MKEPKKLLVYLPPLETDYGSMYEYTKLLIEVGLDLGYDSIKVVCNLDEDLLPKGVRVVQPTLKSSGIARALLLLLDFIRFNCYSNAYDFVFVSQEYVLPLIRKNSLVVFHDLTQIDHPRNVFSKIIVFISIFICKLNDSKIISPSSATQKKLLDHGLRSSVIENHFDMREFHFSNILKFEKINIIWVGTTDAHKRLNFALKAAQDLPSVNFILVVDKPFAMEPMQNVSLFTSVSDDLLSVLFLQSQIYLSTSKDEGFGRPLHEALAYGLDVIVSDIPAYAFVPAGRKFNSYSQMLERIEFFSLKLSIQKKNETIKFKGYSNKDLILSKYKNDWI